TSRRCSGRPASWQRCSTTACSPPGWPGCCGPRSSTACRPPPPGCRVWWCRSWGCCSLGRCWARRRRRPNGPGSASWRWPWPGSASGGCRPTEAGALVPIRETVRIVDSDHHVLEMFESRDGAEARTRRSELTRASQEPRGDGMSAATEDRERFVRDALLQGQSRPAIEAALVAAGWPAEEVREALAAYAEVPFPVPVPRPRPYLSAREAFLYLVMFAS